MKSLVFAIVVFLISAFPVFAQTASPSASPSPTPSVMGLYDEELDSTDSASVSATPTPTATPSARTTTYLDTSNAPVSGSTENTITLLALGCFFILIGLRFSKN